MADKTLVCKDCNTEFIFTEGEQAFYREKGFENEIVFESNRMQYMSTSNKLALVQMVDRMALTPNEWRQIMNLAPVPWGDEPQSWQNPKGASEEESEEEDDKQG